MPPHSQQHFWDRLSSVQGNVFQWMLLLYERVGYEIGKVKRVFIDNNLNWGYYRDHHRQLFHCNSHLNNFVVLPSSPEHNFHCLAPIDFDLAFL